MKLIVKQAVPKIEIDLKNFCQKYGYDYSETKEELLDLEVIEFEWFDIELYKGSAILMINSTSAIDDIFYEDYVLIQKDDCSGGTLSANNYFVCFDYEKEKDGGKRNVFRKEPNGGLTHLNDSEVEQLEKAGTIYFYDHNSKYMEFWLVEKKIFKNDGWMGALKRIV